MNGSDQVTKIGMLDLEINRLSKFLCVFMVAMSFVIVLLDGLQNNWYINFFRFILLLSSIIPISLRVNLDMAKVCYSYLIYTDEDMAKMPRFVVENQRFACPTCAYITIDDVMLLDHISAVHPKMKTFACPHCPGLKLSFDEVEVHLRCHGDLLFKCGYCCYFHSIGSDIDIIFDGASFLFLFY